MIRSWGNYVSLLIAGIVFTAAGCAGGNSTGDETNSAAAQLSLSPPSSGTIIDWTTEMRQLVGQLPATFAADQGAAQRAVLDIYINRQEYLELYWGENGQLSKGGALADAVTASETLFHELMVLVGGSPKAEVAAVRTLTDSISVRLSEIGTVATALGVPLAPANMQRDTTLAAATTGGDHRDLAPILAAVTEAEKLFKAGDVVASRRVIESTYLEEFEPIEPLLPSATVARIEEIIHMRLRPRLSPGADMSAVDSLFSELRTQLVVAEQGLAAPRAAWFGTFSSFALILREGLEAILLIAAMIAYLSRVDGLKSHVRHVYSGAAAGLAASLGTWMLAATLLPMTGAHRELMEGITALLAVAVLLYVSHWIFRRTYMGEWKKFLQDKVDSAVVRGSGFAIAGLSFAAVYREGFETVLFYQALLADMPASSVSLGFVLGAVVIAAVGYAIIRAGLKLPLTIVFRATNLVLLFLSVAILGKGLYNLQEAGIFNPHPLEWLPSSEILSQVLGFYPLAETLIAQLSLLTLVVVMYLVYRRRRDAGAGVVRAVS